MPQLDLFGKPKIIKTCGECAYIYKRSKWWKCDKKIRGMGYDIKKSQPGCRNFKQKIPE